MERLPGVAAGHKVTRDPQLVPDPARLARELAANLARLHRIEAAARRARFPEDHARARLHRALPRATSTRCPTRIRCSNGGCAGARCNAPEREETTFIHRDYRTGNYLVHEGRLAGVLDWEFSAFGNPLEDIGWICVRAGASRGPISSSAGSRGVEDFLPEYERVSGRRVAAAATSTTGRSWRTCAGR